MPREYSHYLGQISTDSVRKSRYLLSCTSVLVQ